MSLIRQYKRLLEHSGVVDLHDSAGQDSLNKTEVCGIKLPTPLIEMLTLFDGGELFVPGTVIYGLVRHGKAKSLAEANTPRCRALFSFPNTYMVFARLNYGDLMCIDTEGNAVIQWDHEKDKEHLRWESLENWLSEAIDDYETTNTHPFCSELKNRQ